MVAGVGCELFSGPASAAGEGKTGEGHGGSGEFEEVSSGAGGDFVGVAGGEFGLDVVAQHGVGRELFEAAPVVGAGGEVIHRWQVLQLVK